MINRPHLQFLLSPKEWALRLVFWCGAVAIGLTAVLFTQGANAGSQLFQWMLSVSPWLSFAVMPLGLGLCAWLANCFFQGSQGSGIPQAIAALHISDQDQIKKLLSLRIALGKILLTIIALCCGASVGREGPTVQIGASIMFSLRRFTNSSHHNQIGGLIIAGGAAGVAAAFNTPLAGIAFAIEELSRSYEQRTNGLILSAIIFAGLAGNAFLGNYTYFGTISTSLGSGIGWLAVLICGFAGGLYGGLFSRLLIVSSDRWIKTVMRCLRVGPIMFAVICGLLLAIIGLWSGHQSYGTGYEEVKQILAHGNAGYQGFFIFKFLAMLVTFFSGVPGGIFAPSLAIGAGLGASLSEFISFAPASTIIILGMVGYFSGVTQAPLTTFIIVMEMTDNHDIVLPLMATALIGHGISRIICHKPVYQALAERFLQGLAENNKQSA